MISNIKKYYYIWKRSYLVIVWQSQPMFKLRYSHSTYICAMEFGIIFFGVWIYYHIDYNYE